MSNAPEVFASQDLTGVGEIFRKLNPPARLAVFGDPIAHSASPPMHNAALRERNHQLQYVRIRVTPEELPQALRNLTSAGFLGASLTIPHKQAALSFMDQLSREAQLMGAINTVAVRDGKLFGFNTDGPGLSAAIHESFGIPLKKHRVLILGGAGGAGRAITVQCALEGSPSVIITNRNKEKGDLLSQEIQEYLDFPISSIPMTTESLGLAMKSVDLIINATPLGMKAGDPSPLPEGLLTRDHLVYDTVYSGGETALLKQARSAGARCAGGFSMLLHQGALQNALWFGETAPLETMRKVLNDLRR
ncbi:MAG: shikimate dehydrogenase [Chthoniobacterales bacterium]|nr:shikimate dehydrogenase [Chthoniobacterales bacterium]